MKKWSMPAFLVLGMSLVFSSMTQPLEAILGSVKASGMGLVGVAYPQDASAAIFNPAGMVDVGDRFDVGITMIHYDQTTTVSGSLVPGSNGTFNAAELKNIWNPDFGINKTICYENCLWDYMSVGLVIYNRGHVHSQYDRAFPVLGTSNVRFSVTQETIKPVLAIKVNDNHSFGIGLDIIGQRVKAFGLEHFTVLSLSPGNVTNRGDDYSWGCGVTLGWRGQFFCDRLSLGFAYQPEISMARLNKYQGLLAERGKLNIPQTFYAGIAYGLLPCVNVAFDINYLQWSKIRSLSNHLVPNIATAPLGSSGGVGFGWHDQCFYRFGIDYAFNDDWTFRAGYRYVRAPMRSSDTATNLLTMDTVQNVFTIGATCAVGCNGELSAFYGHGFNNRIKGHNSVPALLGGGEVDIEQSIDSVGISYGYYY